ncbi:hypothetical protein [Methylophilus sp.]|uniref:hypothetical protein n=1 Tax=Methylophilus sp. TaxID=29541 RepID=UPI0040363001
MQIYAEGFETFSYHEKLNNNLIIAVGGINKIPLRFSESQPYEITNDHYYRIGSKCFSSIFDMPNKPGALLIDQYSNINIGVFDNSVLGIKVEYQPVTLIDCQEVADLRMEVLRKEQSSTQRQLELEKEKLKSMIEEYQKLQQKQKKYK